MLNADTTQKRENTVNRLCASNLSVEDLMSKNVIWVNPDQSLNHAANLMVEHHIHHLPVVDEKLKMVGLLSHRDLLRFSLSEWRANQKVQDAWLTGIRVKDVMQRDDIGKVLWVQKTTPLRSAAIEMLERRFGCLPVVEPDGKICGILTESDFVRMFAEGP